MVLALIIYGVSVMVFAGCILGSEEFPQKYHEECFMCNTDCMKECQFKK